MFLLGVLRRVSEQMQYRPGLCHVETPLLMLDFAIPGCILRYSEPLHSFCTRDSSRCLVDVETYRQFNLFSGAGKAERRESKGSTPNCHPATFLRSDARGMVGGVSTWWRI